MIWLTTFLLSATPLSFEEALARVDATPEIAAVNAAIEERAAGLSAQYFFTSNPQLTLQPGFRSENRATRPEGQLTLTQSFNLGGLGSARAAVARNETERQRWQLQALRRARRVAVAEAWLATWSAQVTVRAADEARLTAEELHARLKEAVRGGGVTRVEAATAAAFAAEASAFHLEWEGRLVDAGTRLSRLLGLPSIATVGDRLPELPTADLSRAVEERFPEVRLIAADIAAEQERLAESRAQWATQLQVSVQGGHEAPGQWFGNVGLGATLPAFERGSREQAAHRGNLLRMEGERNQALVEARLLIDWVKHEVRHAEETYAVVHDAQWPAAEEAARLEARRYENGESTLIELVLLKKQAMQAHTAALAAKANLALAFARARELVELP